MSTQPVPSTLTPFSSLPSKPLHTKVRFLGRVSSSPSTHTGTIPLHDPSFGVCPRKPPTQKRKYSTFLRDGLTVILDIDQVLNSMGALKAGDIVSVIGYVQCVQLALERRQRAKLQDDLYEIERDREDRGEQQEETMPAMVRVQAIVAWHVKDIDETVELPTFGAALVHRHAALKKMDGVRNRWASFQTKW